MHKALNPISLEEIKQIAMVQGVECMANILNHLVVTLKLFSSPNIWLIRRAATVIK